MSATGTRAVAALRRAGIEHVVHSYVPPARERARRDDRPSYGLDAAAALGIPSTMVGKTLVVAADGVLMLAIVLADRTLDLKLFARAVGARRAVMAEPHDAERATGYRVGGISPIGTTRAIRTVLDARAAELPTIHVSAGQRGVQVSMLPADLVRLVGAEVAEISSEPINPQDR